MPLDQLLAALERDARSQAQARLEQARGEASALLDQGRSRLAREHCRRLGALESDAREQARARLVEARRAALRAVLEARQRLFDRVLAEARRRLPAAQRGDAFRAALPEVIEAALSYIEGEPAVVSCPAAIHDEVKRAIGGRPGVTLSIDETIAAGVRVASADGALVVEATLEAGLEQLRPLLLIGMLRDLEEGP